MMLTCTVLLYKLYHRLGSIFLMKDLAEPVSKADTAAVARCPPGELAAFRFFHGMLLVCLPHAASPPGRHSPLSCICTSRASLDLWLQILSSLMPASPCCELLAQQLRRGHAPGTAVCAPLNTSSRTSASGLISIQCHRTLQPSFTVMHTPIFAPCDPLVRRRSCTAQSASPRRAPDASNGHPPPWEGLSCSRCPEWPTMPRRTDLVTCR